MFNITILGGSLSSPNKGVNALTKTTINYIRKANIDSRIVIISVGVIESKKIYEKNLIEYQCSGYDRIRLLLIGKYRLSILKNETAKNILKIINKSDMIFDLSEGDSFSDIYGLKRYLTHYCLKSLGVHLGKKMILLPQTIGPFKNKVIKKISNNVLEKFSLIYSRDRISLDYLPDEISKKTKVIPDLAFSLLPKKNDEIDKLILNLKNNNKIIVGINVSALLYYGGYNEKNMFDFKIDYSILIDKIITNFIIRNDVQILLIPHVFNKSGFIEDDLLLCKHIYDDYFKNYKNISLVDKEYDADELKYIISNCDYFIGSRMHSCIAAISTNIPTSPISYSRKFKGIWDEIGLSDMICDPKINDYDEIINKINNSFDSRDRQKLILAEINKKTTLEHSNIFVESFDLIPKK